MGDADRLIVPQIEAGEADGHGRLAAGDAQIAFHAVRHHVAGRDETPVFGIAERQVVGGERYAPVGIPVAAGGDVIDLVARLCNHRAFMAELKLVRLPGFEIHGRNDHEIFVPAGVHQIRSQGLPLEHLGGQTIHLRFQQLHLPGNRKGKRASDGLPGGDGDAGDGFQHQVGIQAGFDPEVFERDFGKPALGIVLRAAGVAGPDVEYGTLLALGELPHQNIFLAHGIAEYIEIAQLGTGERHIEHPAIRLLVQRILNQPDLETGGEILQDAVPRRG